MARAYGMKKDFEPNSHQLRLVDQLLAGIKHQNAHLFLMQLQPTMGYGNNAGREEKANDNENDSGMNEEEESTLMKGSVIQRSEHLTNKTEC